LKLDTNVQVKAVENDGLAKSSLYFGNNAFGEIATEQIVLCHKIQFFISTEKIINDKST
jgi:hypothetical protein